MPKLATTELPKIVRENRRTLDEKVVRTAVADIAGSYNFHPHAYTDGKAYEEYGKALGEANVTIRELASALNMPSNMFRRKVWEQDGQKDRTKKGKWVFALTMRSEPPAPRKPRQTNGGNPQAAQQPANA